MSAIQDLLRQVTDVALRRRLEIEFARMSKNQRFGLVFEEHIPECTPLCGVPIQLGTTVAKKAGVIGALYVVAKIEGEKALCVCKNNGEQAMFDLSEIVTVAQFGEPIFPTLESIETVKNAPDEKLWHTIIEADNYHALQLLEYLYPKQVDCIYIDPPYNTGARDWKYNNDYVDASDNWRHSKWLSMIRKRLKIAKRLLNPDTGVLIVTIDEHEVYHLGMLLETEFSETYRQMVTIVTTPGGVTQGRFSRVEEYAIYCFNHNAYTALGFDDLLSFEEKNNASLPTSWQSLIRRGVSARRIDRPGMFYPIYVDPKIPKILNAGGSLPLDQSPDLSTLETKTIAWPIRSDGEFGRWRISSDTFNKLHSKGFVKLGNFDDKRKTWTILYLQQKTISEIEAGTINVVACDETSGVVDLRLNANVAQLKPLKTVWNRPSHHAGAHGSTLLRKIFGGSVNFSFPKSLYSTKDAIAAIVRNNPNALILDFFAGSGTTLHAVNLLNAEDNGHRRCILVTNNEVSEGEAGDLRRAGHQPGDLEWERHGICRSVTWPRTKNCILGKRGDGTILDGEYLTNQTVVKEVSRSFYQLGFVDNPSTLSMSAKKQIVAVFRSKDGKSQLPQNLVTQNCRFVVSEKHTTSILFDPVFAEDWITALEEQDHITDFYIVAKENEKFNAIKTQITWLLGPVSVTEPARHPMSKGFPANVEYFKLGFLDKNSVSLGQQFRAILPMLWLKSGAIGERPEFACQDEPTMLILPANGFAVLLDETKFAQFAESIEELEQIGCIKTIYFVTNSEDAFREMSANINTERTYQLYRDYIDNFVLGARRD
jgi:adenine-specific DNA-methyltransferase